MPIIKSWNDLKQFREGIQSSANTYTADTDRVVLAVGTATCGVAAGANETMEALIEAAKQNHLTNVSVIPTGCYGFCYAEPMVEVRIPGKPPVRYGNVDEKMAYKIVDRHVMNGHIIEDAVIRQEVLRP